MNALLFPVKVSDDAPCFRKIPLPVIVPLITSALAVTYCSSPPEFIVVFPPKYFVVSFFVKIILPASITVVPENALLSPPTVRFEFPVFLNVPLPLSFPENESSASSANSSIAPEFIVVLPPRYKSFTEFLSNSNLPPSITVLPENALLFPVITSCALPCLLNVPLPVNTPVKVSSTLFTYCKVLFAPICVLPVKYRSFDVVLLNTIFPAFIFAIPLNPLWFPLTVSVPLPVLLNVPCPLIVAGNESSTELE